MMIKKYVYRNNSFLRYLSVCLIFICFLIPVNAQDKTNKIKKVLVLNSYHPGFDWSDNIMAGIRSEFDKVDMNLELVIEYMDTKRHRPDKVFPYLEKLYKLKYYKDQFDVIVLSDDNALNFILAQRDRLFPDTPVVFCGINNFEDSRIAGQKKITGVIEDFDLKTTIEIALRLHPHTQHIAVVNDNTPTGKANLQRLQKIAPEFKDSVKFIELFNLTANELKKTLGTLPDNTLILLLSFYRDRDGKTFSYKEYIALVESHCDLPIYSAWDFFLGYGILGGMLTDGWLQGYNAAKMAMRILDGEAADDISILRKSPNTPMFDYNQIKRFNLPLSNLPKGSIIINQPKSFYHQHKKLVWSSLSFFTILVLLIIFLSISIIRRKMAEETLRQSENRYRLLVDNIVLGITLIDSDHNIVIVNEARTKMFNKPASAFIGKKCFWEFEKRHEVCSYCPGVRAMDTGLPEAIETEEIRDDGSHFSVRIQVFPISKKNRDVTSFIEVVEDITERKQAEKALAGERERLAVTIGSIGDAVIATDVEGKISLMNKVAEKLTGYAFDEAKDRLLEEVFHIINEKTRKRCKNPVDKVLNTGKVIGLANDTLLISRYGDEKVIADSGSPIRDKENMVIGVVLVFRDITYQRKLEEEFQKNQKIKSVGIAAGGIAHDFNNFLVGILGNLNLAKLQVEKESKMHKLLEDTERATMHAKDLTYQLLTFSKGGTPIKKVFSIDKLIKESVAFILTGSNINCEFDIAGDLWKTEIDPGQINQVLNNLIINAKDAMPEGGPVFVSAKNVDLASKEVPTLKKGSYIKIRIRDNGIGIPEKYLPNIFDPYFTTKQEGSGLGLAITYSIIKNHAGHIKAESNVGEGTIFTIYLSAFRKKNSNKEEAKTLLKKGEGVILVMDDSDIVLDVARKMLEKLGYSVDCARDGESAIQSYEKAMKHGNPYDAVIMDLTIPGGMGGEETIKKLLKIDHKVKAIVSSGYSTDPIMAEYKKYGFKGIMLKPYTIQEISSILDKIFNGKNSYKENKNKFKTRPY